MGFALISGWLPHKLSLKCAGDKWEVKTIEKTISNGCHTLVTNFNACQPQIYCDLDVFIIISIFYFLALFFLASRFNIPIGNLFLCLAKWVHFVTLPYTFLFMLHSSLCESEHSLVRCSVVWFDAVAVQCLYVWLRLHCNHHTDL